MKRAMLMLFAMTFVVSIAYAGFDGLAGPSEQKAFDGMWDESKCCENDHEHHHSPCTEICPGSKPHDEHGCDHGCEEQCDCGKKHHGSDNCFVFERCDECGKTVCDGLCKECGKRCDVYEYCPSCDTKYSVCHADGICDRCGRDCYCIEKCLKCGHNQYFNGYCDECADRCYYARCCMEDESCADGGPVVFIKYLEEGDSADPEPWTDEGYPEVDGMNTGVQDAYEGQMPLILTPEEEAPIDEAPVDEAPMDGI